MNLVNRALVARFCVLGTELALGHELTIARFRAEASSPELPKSGAHNLQSAIVKRLAGVSVPESEDYAFGG
jgi:hypothetical protein